MIKLLNTITEIQNWFKQNIGIPTPIGDYIVPIGNIKYNVAIDENQKIWLKDKVIITEGNNF